MRRLALCFAVCCASLLSQSRLDINRLYSLPCIIGTAPKDFAWSADSKRLAFLWNNEGTNFLDVWMADRNTGKPVRVTHLPRPESPANPGINIQKLEQAAKAETDKGVSGVVWGPDQQHLLVTFKGQLYSAEPGESAVPLFQLTGITTVKTAPKGDKFAFISGANLYVASLTSSKPFDLTAISQPQVGVEDFYWSNDGQTLAFVESDESQIPLRGIPDYLTEETTMPMVKRPFPGEPSERRRLGFRSVRGGGKIRWADLGPDSLDLIFGVSWSPNDQTVLVDKSDLYIKDRRLLLVNPSNGSSSLLLREADPKNVTEEWWSDWAPDGSGVYFTSDRGSDYQVYYMSKAGGNPRLVTNGSGAVFSASVSRQSNTLFFTSNEGKPEERHLYRVSLSKGRAERLTTLAGTHAGTVSPDGITIADYFSNDLTPPDLYFLKPGSPQTELQVTNSPLPEFKNYHWVPARYVTFPSTADGVTIQGRLTLPPNFDKSEKYPAILGSVYSNTVHNQWGGRVAHPTWGLDQYLAQQGYILLNVDIRGSSGHGKAFRQRLGLDYGGIDVEDLSSGVKFLEGQGYVDMQRVGMWGSSYGGLLTTTSLFTKPGVYKAGVAGAPATSLFHALTGEMRTMMAPQDHQAEYTKASAFLKSGGLQDHLMIIHGMRDEVVLFKDSVTLEQRLITQGKDIHLVVLPNAPHSWDTGALSQTRYAYAQLINFFKQYLGEGPR